MESIDTIIIGGGVIGLAIGRALSRTRELCVLEQEEATGTQTSSRNSGVIHAGLYYPQSYLKTRLCIDGRKQLYAYCQQHAIGHRQCGKLLIACRDDEIPRLKKLQQQAADNGIALQWLDGNAIQQHEPAVSAIAGLYSPVSGIIDSDALMRQLSADIEHNGSYIACHQAVTGLEKTSDGFVMTINDDEQMHCRTLINAAGLNAQAVAGRLLPADKVPPLYYCKGQYYSYHGRPPFRHLVYPLPPADRSGLGIHATPDMAGQIRFGPDAVYIDNPDYRNSEHGKAAFAESIRRYFPALDENRLQPDYCGIRPKLNGPGTPAGDFAIQGPAGHGMAGLVNLFGIESPGLTASLAIADYVNTRVAR